MTDTNALRALVKEMQNFLQPILDTDGDPEAVLDFLDHVGWHVRGFVGASLSTLPATIGSLSSMVDRVLDAAQGDELELLAIPQQIGDVAALFRSVVDLSSALSAGMPFDARELPGDLINALTVSYIARKSPLAFHLLELATLVRRPPLELIAHNGVVVRTKNRVPKLDLSRLGDLFTDPQRAFADAYWPNGLPNAPEANAVATRFFPVLARTLNALVGIKQPSPFGEIEFLVGGAPGPSELAAAEQEKQDRMMSFRWIRYSLDSNQWMQLGATVALIPADEGGPGVSVVPFGGWSITIPLGDWFLSLSIEGAVGGLDVTDSGVRAYASDEEDGARLSCRLDRIAESASTRIGPDAGPRVDIKNVGLEVSSIVGSDQSDFKVMLFLEDASVVLNPGASDGFLQSILPADNTKATFGLGVGWSRRGGFHIEGSGGLQIRLPMHLEIGPITFSDLIISALLKDSLLPIEAGVNIRALLGPLTVVVENIGLRVTLSFPANGANFGLFNLELGIKPPNGVGLSIDAGVVKGGGYLYFNFDAEEYAGALELTFSGFLSLKAIGLITTRMPDGSRGFSLLIIITAEFVPGLQLSYGFTLIGVGGLLGLHRTVLLEPLALGVRTGAVNGILFPVDPVANAPRIISDLRTIFPPLQDHFLIGPMAKLGWGTPTLVSLSLGLIIEIPGNVAILGILKVALPVEQAPLIQLQVNFIGAIEFDKQRGWFFAALYESRIMFITLEGEMGMLIAFGADANFVLSVGGFHPSFSPPALPFPSPRRIAFDIVNTPVARIRAEAYFAVTTNTAQVGARAELYFGFEAITVEGHLSFDALMRFSPFYFIVEIEAGASVKAFGVGVFSIDLGFTLEGPTPWRARGRGSVSLLLVEISADFDVTWGEARNTTLPAIRIIPLLTAEFENAANWRALPPPSSNLLVSLRKLDLAADALVLHPLGTLEVSQNAIPLDLPIDKVGAQKPEDANRFSLEVKAGGLVKRRDARRGFAPGQYRNMNDAQKLASRAYEDEVSGLELGVDGAELRTGRGVKRILRYEVTTIDTAYRRFRRHFVALGAGLFTHFLKGNAVSKSSLSRSRKQELQPFDDGVSLGSDRFVVASTKNNRAYPAETTSFASESAARAWLADKRAADPNVASTLHVIPATEKATAA